MLEKEIKILDVDVQKLCTLLEEFWAVKTFDGFIHDVYYDFENDKMQEEKRLFRIRKKWEVHMYTIKRKRKNKKIRQSDEHETEITDVDSFAKVLEKYGMDKIREKKKYRISYKLGTMEFDIDDYYIGDNSKIIPPLLEIEWAKKKDIKLWIDKLWLQDHEKKWFWSRGLFKHYWQDYSYFE